MITRRCTQRQFLLRPDPETTNAFIYCLAFAASRTGVSVIAFVAQANHHHTIVFDPDGKLPQFIEYLHKFVAKHQNCLWKRRENVWASEPTSVVELLGPDDLVNKIVYTLTNPVKDHLVEKAADWPGASSLRATLEGKPICATRPSLFFRRDGRLPESIELECVRPEPFKGIEQEEWGARLRAAIRAVEEAAANALRKAGRSVMGTGRILRQNPMQRPASEEPRRTARPTVASTDRRARTDAQRYYAIFLEAYRGARALWKSGRAAIFPPGTYWLRHFAGVAVEDSPA